MEYFVRTKKNKIRNFVAKKNRLNIRRFFGFLIVFCAFSNYYLAITTFLMLDWLPDCTCIMYIPALQLLESIVVSLPLAVVGCNSFGCCVCYCLGLNFYKSNLFVLVAVNQYFVFFC
jgi:hypothetical protein